jgi:hypothetical protein
VDWRVLSQPLDLTRIDSRRIRRMEYCPSGPLIWNGYAKVFLYVKDNTAVGLDGK